jgi:TctA family transporter
VAAILLLASMAMWCTGMLLAKQVVKVLRIPTQIFMPIIGVLCIIGSYSLGLNIFNLYLMLPVGIICYFLTEMGYPIAPLVIGVILGPMADENLRRALMVSQGSFMPVFTAAGIADSVYHHRLDHRQPVPVVPQYKDRGSCPATFQPQGHLRSHTR